MTSDSPCWSGIANGVQSPHAPGAAVCFHFPRPVPLIWHVARIDIPNGGRAAGRIPLCQEWKPGRAPERKHPAVCSKCTAAAPVCACGAGCWRRTWRRSAMCMASGGVVVSLGFTSAMSSWRIKITQYLASIEHCQTHTLEMTFLMKLRIKPCFRVPQDNKASNCRLVNSYHL